MNHRRIVQIGVVTVLLLPWLEAPADAHNWGCWRQPNRSVYVRNTAANASQAQAALNEWSADTILNLYTVNYHTEVSVYDGNYGATGWGGLASIESSSGCNILHGHATLNTYYSYTSNGKRGVFCQEVGHLFGLDHSNDGGCMGGGYYYSINSYFTVVSHNINDIASKYAGVPAATGGEALEGPRAVALWYHNPRTLAEAYDLAAAVVVARVAAVFDAPDIVVPMGTLASEERRVPNQRIALDVIQTVKGKIDPAIELFHTGNDDFVLEGDPAYAAGETYLLFLLPRPDGSYVVVSPEGRYRVEDDRLEPVSERDFSRLLAGARLDAVLGDLAASGVIGK